MKLREISITKIDKKNDKRTYALGNREAFSFRLAVNVAIVFFALILLSTIQSGLLDDASKIFTPDFTLAL